MFSPRLLSILKVGKILLLSSAGNVLNAIGLGWPTNDEVVIHSLASTVGTEHIQSVTLLGGDAKLQFDQRTDGLHIRMPTQAPAKYAYMHSA